MKFTPKCTTESGRVGKISDLERLPGLQFETPMLLMHTRGGNVPHITYDVLQTISREPLVMHMPITTLITHMESIAEFKEGIAQFVGLQEYPVYVTPQDPAVLSPPGYNVRDSIAVWARTGKIDVNPMMYMTMIENMKPDMYLALCDGDTNITSSTKRVSKSLNRSVQMFSDCLKMHHSSEVLKNTTILAPIVGGYDMKARHASLKEMAVQPVGGYVIDGLHNNGPDAEEISFDSISVIVKDCIHLLPPEKMRVAHGAWSPLTLLHLVAAGFDIFDASLAYLTTEREAALCFPFQEHAQSEVILQEPYMSSDHKIHEKRHSYEIYLKDDRYAEDFRPLLKDCQCLACRQHTRAYVHHLLKTKELLAMVLLMIHNVHHYLEFFKEIRNAIYNDSFTNLFDIVSKFCNK